MFWVCRVHICHTNSSIPDGTLQNTRWSPLIPVFWHLYLEILRKWYKSKNKQKSLVYFWHDIKKSGRPNNFSVIYGPRKYGWKKVKQISYSLKKKPKNIDLNTTQQAKTLQQHILHLCKTFQQNWLSWNEKFPKKNYFQSSVITKRLTFP